MRMHISALVRLAGSVSIKKCTQLKRGDAGHPFGALRTASHGNPGADWTDPVEEYGGEPRIRQMAVWMSLKHNLFRI